MANFKRKRFRSSTMKKCSICGSQRRFGKMKNMPTSKRPSINKKHACNQTD